MKKVVAGLLLVGFLACGNLAFAAGGCECEKGGLLGLPHPRLTLAVLGWKKFNSYPLECTTGKLFGLTIGGLDKAIMIGPMYDTGILTFAIAFRGEERTVALSLFAIGYDYGQCPITWPIHME